MTAPCSKCIESVCDFNCKCECHDKKQNNPQCIRCGDKGMFKRKYNHPSMPKGQFIKAWLCIKCFEEFN